MKKALSPPVEPKQATFRLEQKSAVLETAVLPLHHVPKVAETGLEPATSWV